MLLRQAAPKTLAMTFKGALATASLIFLLFLARSYLNDRDEVIGILVAGPSRLQSSFGPTLTGDALDAYREWSRAPSHFGAFAATDFGDYGWVSSYNSLAAAETAALAYCDAPDCRVFARSVPLNDAGTEELVVSRQTEEAFAEFLTLPGAKAFAIHENGASGSWYRDDTLSDAIAGALAECHRRSRSAERYIPLGEGRDDCRVVHAER